MDRPPADQAVPLGMNEHPVSVDGREDCRAPIHNLFSTLRAHRLVFFTTIFGALFLCTIYCLFAPPQYEGRARVALRSSSAIPLTINGAADVHSISPLMGQAELETLASTLRSNQLAWRVITEEKLYADSAFATSFSRRFPDFKIASPSSAAQAWLIDLFSRRLRTTTVPRTLVVEIRFRSRDAALSARVVNALIRAYNEQDSDTRVNATAKATHWLYEQLDSLKASVDGDDQRLAAFQRDHTLIYSPATGLNAQPVQIQHSAIVQGIDTLGQQLVDATAEGLLRKAQYSAALNGDPELVVASDPRLAAGNAGFGLALLHQLHSQRSDLEQELAQLNLEHGPNFPRTLQVNSQIADIDGQIKSENDRIISRLHAAMTAAQSHVTLLRASLKTSTTAGLTQNEAAAQFAVMQQEAASRRAVYLEVLQKAREAGMAAGVEQSNLAIVDPAFLPIKPVTPDPLIDYAIMLFVGFWLALGGALLAETLSPSSRKVVAILLGALIGACTTLAQAPTPNTSGLPSGVSRIPQSTEHRTLPSPRESPIVWSANGAPQQSAGQTAAEVMPAPLEPGDMVQVSEAHEPIVHATARVSGQGTVSIPLAGEVKVAGLDETAAAHAIESALVTRGMLLHPQVSVLVTSYVGQDVSILGEVARPGVYPFSEHHRLLDFIAAAQGLTPTAGSLVTITPRVPNDRPLAVMLHDADAAGDHNPDLHPGDTVQINKAGLVYIVGDVLRPGGFAVDPAQNLTVVQALTLAWGPSQNAALGKALLIRDQKGGRTVTSLNLKRMLRGQDPDMTIRDRDILFVPDSAAKNLWNRTMESVVQSAAGVSIYAGLVYSQRF